MAAAQRLRPVPIAPSASWTAGHQPGTYKTAVEQFLTTGGLVGGRGQPAGRSVTPARHAGILPARKSTRRPARRPLYWCMFPRASGLLAICWAGPLAFSPTGRGAAQEIPRDTYLRYVLLIYPRPANAPSVSRSSLNFLAALSF